MPLSHIKHFLIQTESIEKTRDIVHVTKVELNYANSEAEGLRAGLKASELPG